MKKKTYNRPVVVTVDIKQTDHMMDMSPYPGPQAKESAVYMSEDVDEKP